MEHFADGNATRLAVEQLYEMHKQIDDNYELVGIEEIRNLDKKNLFLEGINKRIVVLGYNGDLGDVKNKIKFLTAQFNKHNIKPISAATLKNWLSGITPARDNNGRKKVLSLCFALEMSITETAEFMLKSYLVRPFNFKNTHDAVCFYCLLHGKTYQDVVRLVAMVEAIPNKQVLVHNTYTKQIGEELAKITNEQTLIAFLSEHCYTREMQNYTAREKIQELLQACYDEAANEASVELRLNVRKPDSPSALLRIIYDYSETNEYGDTIKNSEFPSALTTNWLNKQAFHDMLHGKNISDELFRRALILLSFYEFYASEYNIRYQNNFYADMDLRECKDEFLSELDATLSKCGFVQSFVRNPYDWLIYKCIHTRNPIAEFREVIAELYVQK